MAPRTAQKRAGEVDPSKARGSPSKKTRLDPVISDCWSHLQASLIKLSEVYQHPKSTETIHRVNRLISIWPADDALPTHGFEDVRKVYRKLGAGLNEIRDISEKDVKAIDDVLERLDVLINLSKQSGSSAPEIQKRNKRPRPPSPSATPISSGSSSVPASANRVSITLPARSSVGPSGRDNKMRRDAQTRQQLPLQQNRKVVFYQPAGEVIGGEKPIMTESPWILAVVTRSPGGDKSRFDYEVQDPEPQDDGKPGLRYKTPPDALLPLPDINAPIGAPSHPLSWKEYASGSTVIALYPDTSCFYKATVIASPKQMQNPAGGRDKEKDKKVIYKLQFADDNNQEHLVSAEWVVDWPGDRPMSVGAAR